MHAVDPRIEVAHVDVEPAGETVRDREAPAPRGEVRHERAGGGCEGAGEDDARDLEGIVARAVAIERDDEIARRRKRDARFLDRDDEVERDELVRGNDAEEAADRVFEEGAQLGRRDRAL
jgi:hypothetical protein